MIDIFYKQKKNNLKEKISIINDAFLIKERWWVDKLDCNESNRRQKIEMSFDDIMLKFNNKCHFVVILRNDNGGSYGEIAFSTMTTTYYYLWIIINVTDLQRLVKKYKLIKYE